MDKLNFIYPEIFISISIMFLLILGVFKKNSSNLINILSLLTLVGALVLIFNYPIKTNLVVFNGSYKIDFISSYMKLLIILSGIFVLLTSSKYLKIFKIFQIEYPILILSSILGMIVMISSNDLIVFYLGLELQSLSLYVYPRGTPSCRRPTEERMHEATRLRGHEATALVTCAS